MKKIALSMMALAMAAVTFTSCEDVPAPYDYPGTGGGSTTEGVYLNQSFAKDLGDFKSFGTNDNIAWTIDYSSACITGYKDFNGDGTKTNEAGVTYLVSPEIDLTKASKAYIEMNHAMKYERADENANNTLLISKDYIDDPTKATWTPIAYPTTGLNDASTKEFVFVTSAANIPAEFIGQKVRIAFRHTCTDKQSSTWEIKTLSVKEGEVENGGGDTPGGENKPGGGETGGEEKPGGGAVEGNTLTVEASAMGIENGTAMPTITLTDGTKLTFDGGGNQNAPKYYNLGTNIRMYPKNSMTITATKNIEKVEFVVDVYSGVTYNASGDISAEPGKIDTNEANIIISGISGKSTKFTNTSAKTGAESQVRIKTIKITYAK